MLNNLSKDLHENSLKIRNKHTIEHTDPKLTFFTIFTTFCGGFALYGCFGTMTPISVELCKLSDSTRFPYFSCFWVL